MSPSLEQCRQAGYWARESGRPVDACPKYGMGEDAAAQRSSWLAGYYDRDREKAREAVR